jgi:5-dehydro-2-deoxygluconokinase
VPGFVGFAVGRTIWWDPLKSWVAGETETQKAVATIAGNYGRMVQAYEAAATAAGAAR